MSLRPIHELRQEAANALARGDVGAARAQLFAALGHGVAREEEYAAAVRELRELLVRTGDVRGALTLDWYLGDERRQAELLERVPEVDRARTLLAWAERSTDAGVRQERYARAADAYERAGLVARAAIAREKADDHVRASALWSRLAEVLGGASSDHYAAGLARFNLARTLLRTGEARAAREATVAAVHLLEEAADRYETLSLRERAFDCYHVLIAIGRESGEFEHVLEGYVNVIRILREDLLKYFALQSYEEAVAAAEQQGELSAAATLAREMAAYARKEGLGSIASFALLTQARLWRAVAEQASGRGHPVDVAENALLASLLAFGEAGQFASVEGVYRQLMLLPLSDARRNQYTRAVARYQGAQDLRIDASPLPRHLRQDTGFPDVWHVDLVEWEQRGSASEAAADVILDPSSWTEVTRRRALTARLVALAFEDHLARGPLADHATTLRLGVALAAELGQVELYGILAPLERLHERPEREIQIAVLRALSRFMFKRTFTTVRRALGHQDGEIAEAAASALEELRFPHAFDPLARIHREASSPRVRLAALRALARIDSQEVAELLLQIVEHGAPSERAALVEALKRSRGSRFIELARRELSGLGTEAQAAVREVLQVRGVVG